MDTIFFKITKILLCLIICCMCNNIAFGSDYKPYKKTLKNQILQRITTEQNNIEIIRNKYEAKSRIKDFCFCYEYLITNNKEQDILLKKIASEHFVGQLEMTNKLITIKYPFLLWGIIQSLKADLEKNKFTRPTPQNYTIKAGETLRILTLSYVYDDPKADFYFLIEDKPYNITVKEGNYD